MTHVISLLHAVNIWKVVQKLNDLDYADDIGLTAHTSAKMQEMMNRLASEGEKVGLVSNQRKTD